MINLNDLVQVVKNTKPDQDWLSQLVECLGGDRLVLLSNVADLLGYSVCKETDPSVIVPDFASASYTDMLQAKVLLFRDSADQQLVLMSNPFDLMQRYWIANRAIGCNDVFICDPIFLRKFLDHHESQFSAVADAVADDDFIEVYRDDRADLSLSSIQEESSPAVKLVNSTVFDALRFEASDIHLESVPHGMAIKFRIDGVLNNIASINSPSLAEQIIARIKVLSELDIAEKRIPQDGRFRVSSKGRDIDIRVSIMPSIHGEDAVLRILDKQALIDQVQQLTLNTLGFDDATTRVLRRLASEPYGMLLVTGPTGSGKTTTLYALMSEINQGEDKFITIEDPVEYQLPGVLQIPVNEKKGLTFAVGLRSILRHDPDKILVGEIRDPETAQIAVQSALTGHLVFTSVHANNTFDVIGRFMHMGVDPYNFVSSLSGVVAQRLVRINCPACSRIVTLPDELILESGISDAAHYGFMAGAGCSYCRHTGYKGRRAIAEVLKLTDDIREMIISRASIRSLKEQAKLEGTRFLREIALDMVKSGQTSLQEANRVTYVA